MSKTTEKDSTTNKDSLYMGSIPIPSSTTESLYSNGTLLESLEPVARNYVVIFFKAGLRLHGYEHN